LLYAGNHENERTQSLLRAELTGTRS